MKSANPCCVIPKKRYHHRKYFSSRVSHARMCDMVGPCNCMLLMFCRNTAGGLYSQMQILHGSFSQITEQANTAQPQTTYKKYRDKGAAVRRLGVTDACFLWKIPLKWEGISSGVLLIWSHVCAAKICCRSKVTLCELYTSTEQTQVKCKCSKTVFKAVLSLWNSNLHENSTLNLLQSILNTLQWWWYE